MILYLFIIFGVLVPLKKGLSIALICETSVYCGKGREEECQKETSNKSHNFKALPCAFL